MPNRTAYNAGMGSHSAAAIDAHLCAGGTVVAASDRAARALASAFHRARRGEGKEAWESPRIYSWHTFIRLAWEERVRDPRLILNAAQELTLWQRLIGESGHAAAVLEGPRRNLAAMAMRGHALLCSHAPQFLESRARSGWEQDCAAFSRWLTAFDELCREHAVVSTNRLPLELIALLQAGAEPRPELLLAGFDRLEPAQSEVLSAWGPWKQIAPGEMATTIQFFVAAESGAELAAAAGWCRQKLEAAPESRILIVAQDVRERRGEFERAFLHHGACDSRFRFEFSLGVPLAQTAPVRTAHLLLRWLSGDLAEHEVDWLIASPCAFMPAESASLQARMRALRQRGMQRTNWHLHTFFNQRVAAGSLPEGFLDRMKSAQRQLDGLAQRDRSPVEWADAVPRVLEAAGWPGTDSPTSAEFQVIRRWQQALDTCGSLGFDGSRMGWEEFLSELNHAAAETLFAPESEDAPILITGPAESAGLTADAIWFLGATEDAWPARRDMHPLLPVDVQRRTGMPHSSPQQDWDLAEAITTRLARCADQVMFSYPRQNEGVEERASRIAMQCAGVPQPVAAEWIADPAEQNRTVAIEDSSTVPLTANPDAEDGTIHLRGGAALLTAQSQCGFKAFATGRLQAKMWDPAQTGLTAAERGQLLHAVLHPVWSGPPNGIRSSHELKQISNLPEFVSAHVTRAMGENVPARVREEMPARYLDIEARRLTALISEWLRYEQTRVDFEVVATEVGKTRRIGRLSLDLRLDRLDRLNDGSLLVIDYKTGDVSPKSWDLPRPEDVQLPLYARFGLDEGEVVGGLAFAKVRPGDMCFAGRVGDARATIDNALKSTSSLVKCPLELEQLFAWRDKIEELARDFIAGRADVDPRDAAKTCERCGLQTLCRISEQSTMVDQPEGEAAYE